MIISVKIVKAASIFKFFIFLLDFRTLELSVIEVVSVYWLTKFTLYVRNIQILTRQIVIQIFFLIFQINAFGWLD